NSAKPYHNFWLYTPNKCLWNKEISLKDKYECYWYIFKDLDNFTYFRVDIEIEVSGSDTGKAKIKLTEPVIVTEYPQETYWQKSFVYEVLRVIWHNAFYRKKLEKYIEWGLLKVSCFEEKLMKYFDKLNNG
ncbi:MAG: hypothetical protein B6U88_02500, partial [Candidatus Aenigmarchaeota archaeon ex4484_56]